MTTNRLILPQKSREDKKLLQVFENIKKSITEIDNLVELRDLRNLADGFQTAWQKYYRASGFGFEQMFLGWETKIRSERKMGELLTNSGVPKKLGKIKFHDETLKPGNPQWLHDETVKLEDLGISKIQSHRYQLLAKIPQEEFDKKIEEMKSKFIEPTTKSVIQLYNEIERKEKAIPTDGTMPQGIELINADFRNVDIENNSIDCILTDPPYPGEYLPLWKDLGLFAKDKLKPGGWLIAYSGQRHLPKVINYLLESLDYYWTFCLFHLGPTRLVRLNIGSAPPSQIVNRWKPILIFYKPPLSTPNRIDSDFIESSRREKELFEWQQSESGIQKLIELFTLPGETVLDPFSGSGTFPIVANRLGRKAIGIEIDKELYNIAKNRSHDQT